MFGGTRCSPTGNIHKDSDRFVWRRATSCLIFNGSFVVGEKPNCAEKDLIDIFSYTYDNGSIPYENQGVLSNLLQLKLKLKHGIFINLLLLHSKLFMNYLMKIINYLKHQA